jgi:hypothetical protein
MSAHPSTAPGCGMQLCDALSAVDGVTLLMAVSDIQEYRSPSGQSRQGGLSGSRGLATPPYMQRLPAKMSDRSQGTDTASSSVRRKARCDTPEGQVASCVSPRSVCINLAKFCGHVSQARQDACGLLRLLASCWLSFWLCLVACCGFGSPVSTGTDTTMYITPAACGELMVCMLTTVSQVEPVRFRVTAAYFVCICRHGCNKMSVIQDGIAEHLAM